MNNTIKTHLKVLEKEAKIFAKLGLEVTMTFRGKKASFHIMSSSNTAISVLELTFKEDLNDLVASINASTFAKMLKGVNDKSFIGYSDSILQVVKGKKAVTTNIMEPNVYDVKTPNLKPSNAVKVDTKRIVDFLKEAVGLLAEGVTVKIQQQRNELILIAEHEGNNIVEALEIELVRGDSCSSKYNSKLLLEILGSGKECILEFGNDYPIRFVDVQEDVKSFQVLANVVSNE